MSYEAALKAAGAEILDFKMVGSYQGRWAAKIVVNGQEGYVFGFYGSCSGCDSWQAECESLLPWDHKHGEEYVFSSDIMDNSTECPECNEARNKIASFGRAYLSPLYSREQAVEIETADAEWSDDAKELYEWITGEKYEQKE